VVVAEICVKTGYSGKRRRAVCCTCTSVLFESVSDFHMGSV